MVETALRRLGTASVTVIVLGSSSRTTRIVLRRITRLAGVGATAIRTVVVIIVHVIRVVLIIVFIPVEHTFSVLEMIGNVIYTILARDESMSTETALSGMGWEAQIRMAEYS